MKLGRKTFDPGATHGGFPKIQGSASPDIERIGSGSPSVKREDQGVCKIHGRERLGQLAGCSRSQLPGKERGLQTDAVISGRKQEIGIQRTWITRGMEITNEDLSLMQGDACRKGIHGDTPVTESPGLTLHGAVKHGGSCMPVRRHASIHPAGVDPLPISGFIVR